MVAKTTVTKDVYLEVLCALGEVAKKTLDNRVQVASSCLRCLAKTLILHHALEGLDVIEIRDKSSHES